MGEIDVGEKLVFPSGGYGKGYTLLFNHNPANASGALTSIVYMLDEAGSSGKVGTFYGAGTSWTNRDYHTIGDTLSGVEQTISGVDIDVEEGDVLGFFNLNGQLLHDNNFGASVRKGQSGDQFDAGTVTYSFSDDYGLYLYAEGVSVAVAAGPVLAIDCGGIDLAAIDAVGVDLE